jgi:hypothetical protein
LYVNMADTNEISEATYDANEKLRERVHAEF